MVSEGVFERFLKSLFSIDMVEKKHKIMKIFKKVEKIAYCVKNFEKSVKKEEIERKNEKSNPLPK